MSAYVGMSTGQVLGAAGVTMATIVAAGLTAAHLFQAAGRHLTAHADMAVVGQAIQHPIAAPAVGIIAAGAAIYAMFRNEGALIGSAADLADRAVCAVRAVMSRGNSKKFYSPEA